MLNNKSNNSNSSSGGSLGALSVNLGIGSLFDQGRFKILRSLGEGLCSHVYLAEDRWGAGGSGTPESNEEANSSFSSSSNNNHHHLGSNITENFSQKFMTVSSREELPEEVHFSKVKESQ